MKIGITYRMFLAILSASAMAVVCMFLVMQWSIGQGFLRYVNRLEEKRFSVLVSRLEENYARNGNWDFLRRDPTIWQRLVTESMPMEGEVPPGPPPGLPGGMAPLEDISPPGGSLPPPPPPPSFHGPYFLLDAGRKPLSGPSSFPPDAELKPIRNKGAVVGYLGLIARREMADIRQLTFVKEQRLVLLLVAVMLVFLTAGLSFPLARRLVRPIRALANATRRLAAGEYSSRVPETTNDELGRLARDFNALAITLEENERARRQWVADISHELRTPLAILRGEVEAIQDGIREPSPDSIRSLHGEVMRLNRLVDDLYQLSMADLGALTYRKENIDPADPLSDSLSFYREEFLRKKIAVEEDIPRLEPATVFGDKERLRQLFTNILDNSLKYTDEGGKLFVRLNCRDHNALVDIEDSAPGVPERDLERLFERLYRVEASRNREAGGAGLGLAICRSIVEAHAGSIVARPSKLGGVWIRVALPLAEIEL
jgi:two-component system sensor histidine kinase BaeS